MLKLRSLLIPSLFFLFTLPIHAQDSAIYTLQQRPFPPPPHGGSGGVIAIVIGGSALSGKPGLPFSADFTEETDKSLADGNHIHRESHGRVFRDSQGRTRTETEVNIQHAGAPIVHVTIMNPVEGEFITLDLTNKTATVSHFPQHASSSSNAKKTARIPPAAQTNAAPTAGRIQSSEPETKELEGFTVSVTHHTRTTPAGENGNDKPLVTTGETWYSKDLGMALLTVSENPETGKFTRKLMHIHTGDPDPLLFQVPADFTVKEMPQH